MKLKILASLLLFFIGCSTEKKWITYQVDPREGADSRFQVWADEHNWRFTTAQISKLQCSWVAEILLKGSHIDRRTPLTINEAYGIFETLSVENAAGVLHEIYRRQGIAVVKNTRRVNVQVEKEPEIFIAEYVARLGQITFQGNLSRYGAILRQFNNFSSSGYPFLQATALSWLDLLDENQRIGVLALMKAERQHATFAKSLEGTKKPEPSLPTKTPTAALGPMPPSTSP